MKMLVPVDGSVSSLKAVETACDLAKSQPLSSVILLAVAIELPELEEGRYIADKMKAQAEAALAKAKEVAKSKGLDTGVEILLATGASPAEEIVQWPKIGKPISSSSAAGAWPARPRPSWAAPPPRW